MSSNSDNTLGALQKRVSSGSFSVESEMLRLLFSQVTSSSLASIVGVVVLTAVLWQSVSQLHLVVWLVVMVAINGARMLLAHKFNCASNHERQGSSWHRLFALLTAGIGVAWGVGTVLFMQQLDFTYQLFVVFMAGGMAAGAVAAYAASILVCSLFILPAIVPPALWLLLHQSSLHTAIGVVSLLFAAVMLAVAAKQHRSMIENLGLRAEKESLLDQLQAGKARHERAQELAHLGHWVLDSNTDQLTCSEQTLRILGVGLSPGELSSRSFFDAVHPLDQQRVDEAFAAAIENRNPFDMEYRLQFADGEVKWVHVLCEISRDVDGSPYKVEGMLQEISERKHIEVELIQSRDRAEMADRAKSDFLANMSHEIRTPLHGMLGMAEHLKDTELDLEQQQSVETLISSGGSLLSLINDILDFSKIEAGQLELDHSPLSPQGVVNEVLQMFDRGIGEKGIQLSCTLVADNNSPAHALGDLVRIRQVLINLVGNAVKFTEQGEVVVSLSEKRLDGGLVSLGFAVRDSGIGIAENHISSIFDKFNQAETSTTRKFGGTGIGLSISRDLVALMGGEISVESRLNEGSCFSFEITLPEVEEEGLVPVILETSSTDEQRLARSKILIVDDNAVNRKVLDLHLLKLGCQVDHAVDGQEAVDMVLEGVDYSLILMDMHMPVMDGLEATVEIRSAETESQHVPIIAMTANILKGTRESCLTAGMDDYLTKPTKLAELKTMLLNYLPM